MPNKSVRAAGRQNEYNAVASLVSSASTKAQGHRQAEDLHAGLIKYRYQANRAMARSTIALAKAGNLDLTTRHDAPTVDNDDGSEQADREHEQITEEIRSGSRGFKRDARRATNDYLDALDDAKDEADEIAERIDNTQLRFNQGARYTAGDTDLLTMSVQYRHLEKGRQSFRSAGLNSIYYTLVNAEFQERNVKWEMKNAELNRAAARWQNTLSYINLGLNVISTVGGLAI